MMFGWSGLAFQNEYGFSTPVCILAAVFVGVSTVFLLNCIFKLAKTLQSSGNSCNLDDVIGKEAQVYQRIPAAGKGKISITFEHLTCEIDAMSENEIASFTRVQIIQKKDETTVVVKPI